MRGGFAPSLKYSPPFTQSSYVTENKVLSERGIKEMSLDIEVIKQKKEKS